MSWQEKQQAALTITEFSARLALTYDAKQFHRLMDALKLMQERYGDVFVANCIRKDPKDAELALFRYGKFHRLPEVPEAEPLPARHQTRFRKTRPNEHRWARRTLLAAVGMVIIGFAGLMLIEGSHAVTESDRVIAEADRILAEVGR